MPTLRLVQCVKARKWAVAYKRIDSIGLLVGLLKFTVVNWVIMEKKR